MFQIRNCLTHGLAAATVASAAVFHVPAAQAATEAVLYSFQGSTTDGSDPRSGLINVNGTLYGTTTSGGSANEGAVFSINPTTKAETVVYSFGTNGSTDGRNPTSGLINVNGKLYGTTSSGGSAFQGTVFSITPKTGAETVVYSFCSQANCTDGASPEAGLIDVGGTLYGTTYQGGGAVFCTDGFDIIGCGTVFKINPTTGAEKVVYAFQGGNTDGKNPAAGLISVKGTLYGTTYFGGTNGYGGTVFKVNPTTGAEKVVHSFQGGTDGNNPDAGLIDVAGKLYGTTYSGGAGAYMSDGTVFSISPNTGVETVVYSFCSQKSSQAICTDGAYPEAGLINDSEGNLYGTTFLGGGDGCNGESCGTAFKITP